MTMKHAVTFSIMLDTTKVQNTMSRRGWTSALGLDTSDSWDAIYEAIAFEAMTGGDYTEFAIGGMSVGVDRED